MSVTVVLSCNGCDAATDPIPLRRRFVPTASRDWSRLDADTVQGVAPDGWIAYDPYTLCTYCPVCWASIEAMS